MELGKKQIVQDVPVKERDVDADVEFLDSLKDYIARTKNPRVLKYVKRCRKEISLAGLLEAVSGQNRYYYSDGDLELFHATVTRCCIASGWIQLWMEIIFSAENINMLRLDTVEYLLRSWELLRAIYVPELLHVISVRYYDLFLDELDAPIEEWPLRRHFAKLARQNLIESGDIVDKFTSSSDYSESAYSGSFDLNLLGGNSHDKPFASIEVSELMDKIQEIFHENGVEIEIDSVTINPATTVLEIEKMPPITKKLLTRCERELAEFFQEIYSRLRLECDGHKVQIHVTNSRANTSTIADVALGDLKYRLRIPIGRNIQNRTEEIDFANDGHLLYANYGNIGFATNLALSLMWKHELGDIYFAFLGSNKFFSASPYSLFRSKDSLNANDALGMLKALKKESDRRTMHPAEYPPIFVFIEDFDELSSELDNEKLCNLINDIAADWRVNNIHFVIRYLGTAEQSCVVPLENINHAAIVLGSCNCTARHHLIGNANNSVLFDDEAYYSRNGMTKLITTYGFDERRTANICDYLRIYGAPKYWDYTPELSISTPNKDITIAAIKVICEAKMATTSLLQRRLRIGYGKAACIIDELVDAGIVSDYNPESGDRGRRVFVANVDKAIEKYRDYRD